MSGHDLRFGAVAAIQRVRNPVLVARCVMERSPHALLAGGGALQWVLHAPSTNWSLQATMWPGSLHLFVSDAEDEDEQLYRARATRNREYYLRKYPMV